MSKSRIKKSVWIPIAFALYSAVIYAIFVPRSDASASEIALTIGVNILILAVLFVLYRRKEKMAERRQADIEAREKETKE